MSAGIGNANSTAISTDMLETFAAINRLAVADVVLLFLLEALPEGDGNWNFGIFACRQH
jgi:hypothetical protein